MSRPEPADDRLWQATDPIIDSVATSSGARPVHDGAVAGQGECGSQSRNVHGDDVIFEAWSEQREVAETLTVALEEVIDEIRSIDLLDLVSFVRFENHPALEDLLQASTELFYRPGTLVFGWTARVEMAWTEVPVVTFGMEFRHDAVAVFFDLTLAGDTRNISITATQFAASCRSVDERVACLADALASARVPRRTVVGPRSPRR